MIGDNGRTIVVLITLGLVLAGTSTLFLHGDADEMPLKARDVGQGWSDGWRQSPMYPSNWTINNNFTYSARFTMSNRTLIISSELMVLKSPELCSRWFQNETAFMGMNDNAGIGDQGYIYRYGGASCIAVGIDGQVFFFNSSNIIGLIFVKGDTMVKMSFLAKGIDVATQPWIRDFALEVGNTQLQKIDQYLAKHQGAS